MLRPNDPRSKPRSVDSWFTGKPPEIRALFDHFISEYKKIGKVTVRSAKSMIIVTTPRKGIAYIVTGRKFVHVVLPFKQAYPDNLCFQKIAQVPLSDQFNHHLRLFAREDVNAEVRKFMKLAYELGK